MRRAKKTGVSLGRFRLVLLVATIAVFAVQYVKLAGLSQPSGFAYSADGKAFEVKERSDYKNRYASQGLTPTVHSAAALVVKDGVRGFWYGGTREGSRDTAIYSAFYSTRSSTWNDERPVITREFTQQGLRRFIRKLGNPAVVHDAQGRIWLFYVSVSVGGWSGSSINVVTSADEGRTWSAPRRLVTSPFFNLSTLVKGRPFLYSDGTIGLPVYHELMGVFGELLRIDAQGRLLGKTRLSWGRYSLQPVIVVQSPTKATGFMRNCGTDAGRVLMFATNDAGRSWSEPAKTPLYNPNAAVDALGVGDDLLLVFNNRENERDDLSLAVSSDSGQHWKVVHTFKSLVPPPDGLKSEFSYPSILRDDRGRFHLLYTWTRLHINHVEFTRRWLEQQL